MRRRTVGAVIALDVAVSGAWAFTTVLTSAGPAPFLHLTLSPVTDAQQLAAMVTADTTVFFTVIAGLNAACYLIAGLRARRKARIVVVDLDEAGATPENPAVRNLLDDMKPLGRI